MPGEPGPQVIRAGRDWGGGLVDGPRAFSGGAAPGDHQGRDRLDGAVPALGRAAGPAGLRGPRGADRVQGIGLALPATVLPVRAVHLDDPDAGRGDVACPSRALTAASIDARPAHGAHTAPPAPQAGV